MTKIHEFHKLFKTCLIEFIIEIFYLIFMRDMYLIKYQVINKLLLF